MLRWQTGKQQTFVLIVWLLEDLDLGGRGGVLNRDPMGICARAIFSLLIYLASTMWHCSFVLAPLGGASSLVYILSLSNKWTFYCLLLKVSDLYLVFSLPWKWQHLMILLLFCAILCPDLLEIYAAQKGPKEYKNCLNKWIHLYPEG